MANPSLTEPTDAEVDAFVEANPGGMSLDQIAEAMHISKQRAGQLVAAAISKFQVALRQRHLKPDDIIPFG